MTIENGHLRYVERQDHCKRGTITLYHFMWGSFMNVTEMTKTDDSSAGLITMNLELKSSDNSKWITNLQ